jgi:hypothetical protein
MTKTRLPPPHDGGAREFLRSVSSARLIFVRSRIRDRSRPTPDRTVNSPHLAQDLGLWTDLRAGRAAAICDQIRKSLIASRGHLGNGGITILGTNRRRRARQSARFLGDAPVTNITITNAVGDRAEWCAGCSDCYREHRYRGRQHARALQ